MNDSGLNSKGDSISLKSVFKTDTTLIFDHRPEYTLRNYHRKTLSPESGNALAETKRI